MIMNPDRRNTCPDNGPSVNAEAAGRFELVCMSKTLLSLLRRVVGVLVTFTMDSGCERGDVN